MDSIKNEVQLIENKEMRGKFLDNIEVLDKVKKLIMLPNATYTTPKLASEYFNVGYDAIDSIIRRNKNELQENGLQTLRGKQQINKKLGFRHDDERVKILGNTTVLTIISKRTMLNIAMLLRDSEIAKEIRRILLDAIEDDVVKENIYKNITEEQLLQLEVINAENEEKRLLAFSKFNQYKNRHINKLEDTIKIQEPKVKIYETLVDTDGLSNI